MWALPFPTPTPNTGPSNQETLCKCLRKHGMVVGGPDLRADASSAMGILVSLAHQQSMGGEGLAVNQAGKDCGPAPLR